MYENVALFADPYLDMTIEEVECFIQENAEQKLADTELDDVRLKF